MTSAEWNVKLRAARFLAKPRRNIAAGVVVYGEWLVSMGLSRDGSRVLGGRTIGRCQWGWGVKSARCKLALGH